MVVQENVLRARDLNLWYGSFRALKDINIAITRNRVTALIGPSGCGKSTLLRCFDRMNELLPGVRVQGEVTFNGQDLYAPGVDPTELRSRIGMVFQKPNPFPKSIFENVAFGLRINGFTGNLQEAVERSLRRAALWDEVKDRLSKSALTLSGGQQQRLCIARALAVEPEVVLMDEPASALDPIATLAIEELIRELVVDVTIVIVTHNMQQAARVSHETAFLMMGDDRAGYVVEHGMTQQIFTDPQDERTEAYITGRVQLADRGKNMVRATFDRDLRTLQDELLFMGSMVEKAISRALDALKRRDLEASRQVVLEDDYIDRKRFELEDRCINLIATQQPMAGDLRAIITILHISVELERMGDYAEGIGKISIMMGDQPPLKPLIDIPRMAEKATAMLRQSLDALVNRDLVAAHQVCNDDDYVDGLYDQIYRELLLMMIQDPTSIQRATYLLWVAHDLERIADRATNIAERAIYLVTGKMTEINVSKY